MPLTREEHVTYTRNELNHYPYYINVIKILENENIVSYIDIGANVGEFCNVLFEKLKTLQTAYLIEPEEENYKFMLNNVKHKDKIITMKIAIGYKLSNCSLISYDNNVGGFRLIENENDPKIVIKTLEEINLPIVDLIKIDVEGMEYNIIENSTYLQNIKFIELEFHDHHNIPVPDYISKNFPTHSILEMEDYGGRCLIKKMI